MKRLKRNKKTKGGYSGLPWLIQVLTGLCGVFGGKGAKGKESKYKTRAECLSPSDSGEAQKPTTLKPPRTPLPLKSALGKFIQITDALGHKTEIMDDISPLIAMCRGGVDLEIPYIIKTDTERQNDRPYWSSEMVVPRTTTNGITAPDPYEAANVTGFRAYMDNKFRHFSVESP